MLFETWLVPFEGYLVDRFGPRIVVLAGGFLAGLAWILNAYASTLAVLYLAQIIGGIGAGAVYGTAVGNALKWFPDHRGFATGLTAAGFGIGSALTIIPIQHMIATRGYQATFFTFGLGQGIVVMVLACFLFAPQPGQVPEGRASRLVPQGRHQYEPFQVLREPVFWVMYVMFVMMAAGGWPSAAVRRHGATNVETMHSPKSAIARVVSMALTVPTDPLGLLRRAWL